MRMKTKRRRRRKRVRRILTFPSKRNLPFNALETGPKGQPRPYLCRSIIYIFVLKINDLLTNRLLEVSSDYSHCFSNNFEM
jgi:hypothetical protein